MRGNDRDRERERGRDQGRPYGDRPPLGGNRNGGGGGGGGYQDRNNAGFFEQQRGNGGGYQDRGDRFGDRDFNRGPPMRDDRNRERFVVVFISVRDKIEFHAEFACLIDWLVDCFIQY